MNIYFEQKAKNGAVISVNAWMTFEGNPIMRLQEFHDWQKTSLTVPFLVRMEINFPEDETVFKYGGKTIRIAKIHTGKVNAFREQWMTFPEFCGLVSEFEKYGTDYIFTFELTRK